MAQWLGISWVTAFVLVLVNSLTVVAALEYDRFRSNHDIPLSFPERMAVQYGITLAVVVSMFLIFHNRARIGDDVFFSPLHTSVCIGQLCAGKMPGTTAPAAGSRAGGSNSTIVL